jgi:hypothetical protein
VGAEPERNAPPLLAGEEPETEHLEDVEHWIAVYAELLAGACRLRESPPEDERRLDAELERLRGRLAFWLARRAELPPSPRGHDSAASAV